MSKPTTSKATSKPDLSKPDAAQLTDTQLAVLSSAMANNIGIAVRPTTLKPLPASKVVASLVAKGLAREVQAKAGWPVWRTAGDGKAFSLKILKAGRTAIEEISAERTGDRPAPQQLASETAVAPATVTAVVPRAATKIGGVVGLLQRREGATADEMIAATGWLPHTLRAALTGLRKRGYAVERTRVGDGTAYRIASESVQAAA